MKIIVVGGGAAGFFAAINLAEKIKNAHITILEKSHQLLSKVKVSGGGRCNVCNATFDVEDLLIKFPRGNQDLRNIFYQFSSQQTINWFEEKRLKLKTESDGRVFPITNKSESVIQLFLTLAQQNNILIATSTKITDIKKVNHTFEITSNEKIFEADVLVIASGGNIDAVIKKNVEQLGHSFTPLYPSLFSFNIPYNKIFELKGMSLENVCVKICNTNFKENGALLFTHWGFSGPVILKLSAWAAIFSAHQKYEIKISINWVQQNYNLVLAQLLEVKKNFSNKKIAEHEFNIPKRLWLYLLEKISIQIENTWQTLSNNQLKMLSQILCEDEYNCVGKTTNKEEFVTCGGVDLKELNLKTLESKIHSNLFFSGEVLNFDGLTGGFNFQNAWSNSWVISEYLKNKIK